ncbi:MAG: WYL domain-containing protein [Erysipelotrichaceae bacterium]|nr:WYL domain-containing protein [Erysipelotrichaceae bacterium]
MATTEYARKHPAETFLYRSQGFGCVSSAGFTHWQTIEQIDENTIKVSLDMQNEGAIVSFALGCGLDLYILSPDWLKERVRDVAKEPAARYDTEAN